MGTDRDLVDGDAWTSLSSDETITIRGNHDRHVWVQDAHGWFTTIPEGELRQRYAPPPVPVPDEVPRVIFVHPDHVPDRRTGYVHAYLFGDHACNNESGTLRYELIGWEKEPK